MRPKSLLERIILEPYESISEIHRDRISHLTFNFLLILLTFTPLLLSPNLAGATTAACAKQLRSKRTFDGRPKFTKQELLDTLRLNGQLIYDRPSSEFLQKINSYVEKNSVKNDDIYWGASNEHDWVQTPFDNKHSDTVIAFGTNSAFEIAANKRSSSIIFVDVFEEPILGLAYFFAPTLRVSKSPQELILLLSGIIPTPELLSKSVNDVFEFLETRRKTVQFTKEQVAANVAEFMDFMAQKSEITDLEFQYLSAQHILLTGYFSVDGYFGSYFPINTFLNRHNFRYLLNQFIGLNQSDAERFYDHSFLHNLNYFRQVKTIFNTSTKYAIAEIDDLKLYQEIRSRQNQPDLSYTLSISNIFDVDYNENLDFSAFRAYLANVRRILMNDSTKPMTVFRTTGSGSEHGFYRYAIGKNGEGIPLEDEIDSEISYKSQ